MRLRILGLSGSARRGSFNTALLRAAAELVPPDVELAITTIAGIPVYDGDVEAERGVPESVVALKDAIRGARGLVIATPEYNGSLPGPLKNAIDWCSRPPAEIPEVFGGRPVALVGATPGRLGTALAQNAWLPVFRALKLRYWSTEQLLVPAAHEALGREGPLESGLARRLAAFVEGFAAFCREATGR